MAQKATKETAVKEAKEIKSIEVLEQELATKRTDLLEARRSNASGELVNPRAITAYKKDIARLLTEINERKGK